ncbi:hypothetical protein ACFYWX_27450 [Streptomyces sp. NPDC002888]|uniref:hypothetical protein n=1 Tax=Streptomyces sp. NPDC002888 TaxID=3364668 RepID=UPI0036A49815
MSTPPDPSADIKELKKKHDEQQTQLDQLTSKVGSKLTASEFGKLWDQKKQQADDQAKLDNNKLYDDYEGYQATARTGQKSELNWAKEEINGLNAAVNTLEASWSITKLELKPLYTFKINDKLNDLIGRFQDWAGLPNPEREAEQRLVRMETGIDGLKTRAGRLDTAAGHLQNRANDAHVRIGKTNKRIDELQRKAAQTRRDLRSNDGSARSTSPGNLSGTEADLRRLENRVQALVRSLG